MVKTAIIIKGNSELVAHNPRAIAFYNGLKMFIESLGFLVTFDSGEPYTQPEPADMWIGHSRGADRLRFAPKGTIVIGVGVPENVDGNDFPIVNHLQDESVQRVFDKGRIVVGKLNEHIDDMYHYVLSTEMKEKIEGIIHVSQNEE